MIALLIITTFVLGILFDAYMTRRYPIRTAEEGPAASERPRLAAKVIGGFAVPENVRFHPGHMWALAESPELIRIGADDLAAKVAGDVTEIEIPQRGQWVRQGQKIVALKREGRDVTLVSPIEGTVVGVNEAALIDPKRVRKDPYGDGWLLTINAPDALTNFRNLLGGSVARRWMEEAAGTLRRLTPAAVGAVAYDGGVALDNAIGNVPADEFRKVEKELFLI